MARVTAIIVSYHTGPRLKECLYAVSGDPDIDEVVVVDNGNSEAMRDWLSDFAARREHVTVLPTEKNIGFGAAVNLGAREARGDHYLILNPDAVLKRGSVVALLQASQSLPTPWIVGGKIFNLRGIEERGPRRRDLTLWRALTSFIGFKTWTLEHTPSPHESIEMDVISGAFFMTSKQSFEALGGFDEGYFLHVEDVDLCFRCREMGGSILYQPHAGALHYGSTSEAPGRVIARHKADGLARYFRKRAKGPIHRAMTEMALPFIRLALLLRAGG